MSLNQALRFGNLIFLLAVVTLCKSLTAAPFEGTPWIIPGRIQAVKFDEGPEGQAYHDLTSQNTGGASYRNGGVDIEDCLDSGGGYDVSWIGAGEWLNFSVNVPLAGDYTLRARVASDLNDGAFRVEFAGVDKTGTLPVARTGGWQSWQTLTKEHIRLNAGAQIMRVFMAGGGFNLNWIELGGPVQSPGSGAVRVLIEPAEAAAAGAQWAIDGAEFHPSGELLGQASVGAHNLSFKPAQGFGLPPKDWVVTVTAGATTDIVAWYSINPPLVNWRLPPVAPVTRHYPKLANYHHGSPNNEDDGVDQLPERIAQWDLVIYGDIDADRFGISAPLLRKTNPRLRLLSYAMYGSGPARNAAGVPPEGPNDWFIRGPDGKPFLYWWGGKAMNPYAQDFAYPKYYADLITELYLRTTRWDGVLLDVFGEWASGDVNRDGRYDQIDQQLYREGNMVILNQIRTSAPGSIILGNAGLPWSKSAPFYQTANGSIHENALGNEFVQYSPSAANWETAWQGYRDAMNAAAVHPFFYVIAGDVQFDRSQDQAGALKSLAAEDLRRMRLGLGTTLLDEGYFSFDRGDGWHGQLWWFDEYDADLGPALGPFQRDLYGAGVYHRYFQNGTVIVNPTRSAKTIILGADMIDVSTKHTAAAITIPERDARILLGQMPRSGLKQFVSIELRSGTLLTSAQTISIQASAFSESGINRVELYDGDQLLNVSAVSPFAHNWTISRADNRMHILSAKLIDSQGNTALSTPLELMIDIPGEQQLVGSLRRRVFRNIPGPAIANMTSSPKFPDRADQDDFVYAFESSNFNEDNYGQLLTGFIVPPVTGDFVFYLAADDNGQLWLSSDETAANKRLIVQEPEWNFERNWSGATFGQITRPGRKSVPIPLQAGHWYYVEAVHKEALGGDHLSVTWQLPGAAQPLNGSHPIPGQYLAPKIKALPPKPSLKLDVYAGLTVTGSVGQTYRVEYSDDPTQASWVPLGAVTLPQSPYLYIDTTAPLGKSRFYRVTTE